MRSLKPSVFSSIRGKRERPAGAMEKQIPEAIKEQRLGRLAAVQQEAVAQLNKKMVGSRFEVVIEKYHPETDLLLVGRYFGQCPEIDGQVNLNDWLKVDTFGERYLVEITDTAGYDLVGRVLKPVKAAQKLKMSSIS